MSIVLGIVALVAGCFDRTGNRAHKIARLWCRLLCEWNGIRVTVTGLENVSPDTAQIFVANHQSYFDIFALSGFLPVQIRWVAKASLYRIPFIGWSMKAAQYVSVDRQNKKKAYQAFLETIEKLKMGYSVVIFPEGTRSADETIGPFKKGSHLLALRSKSPMVPVTIIGSGRIIKKRNVVVKPGPVRIIIAPPIRHETLARKKEEDVLEWIRQIIVDNYSAGDGPAEAGLAPAKTKKAR